jgi:hypothetical protein
MAQPVTAGVTGPELMPLFAAAAIAYERVFCTRRTAPPEPTVDELDLVALALSVRLPIYGVRVPGQPPARISGEELSHGMFWGGGARFELSDGSSTAITKLAVRRDELERVLAELKSSPLEI